jgi:hypothetical protein
MAKKKFMIQCKVPNREEGLDIAWIAIKAFDEEDAKQRLMMDYPRVERILQIVPSEIYSSNSGGRKMSSTSWRMN